MNLIFTFNNFQLLPTKIIFSKSCIIFLIWVKDNAMLSSHRTDKNIYLIPPFKRFSFDIITCHPYPQLYYSYMYDIKT